ncbi:hypothetical protein LIER_35962 [Lithospermum erythrorhizon]|uniref:Uncharacterized protein n=1 Tax=Lithospermum erythrorhizon TaxID=34254 RepID=A0AAV3NYT2_LITER
MLKTLANEIPSTTSRPSKRLKKSATTKKTAQLLAQDSREEATQSLGEIRRSEERISLPEELDTPFPLNEQFPPNAEVQKATLEEVVATKNSLLDGEKGELSVQKTKIEGLSKTVEERDARIKDLLVELEKEKAATIAEKADMQARYEELQRTNGGEIMKATEALSQAKKEKEIALTSSAAEAKVARVQFAKETLRAFMKSPSYTAKVGRECAAYLTHLVIHGKGILPELVNLFATEQHNHPDLFEGLSLNALLIPADKGEEDDDEEDVKLPGEGRSPQPSFCFQVFISLSFEAVLEHLGSSPSSGTPSSKKDK